MSRYGVPWSTNGGGSGGGGSTPVPSQFTVHEVDGPATYAIPGGTLAAVFTAGGAVTITPPGSGTVPVGTFFGVGDFGANAATTAIAVGGLSIHIEDPNNPGSYSSSVNITTTSQVVWWMWGPISGGINGWKIWAEGALPNSTAALGPLATLPNGTADQLVGMNHAGSAPNYFTAAGDLTLASASFKVVGISGASPISITPAVLQWAKSTVAPTLGIAAQTTDVACNDVHIAGQTPFASSTGTNRNAGNVFVDLAAPAAGGAEGAFEITRDGTPIATCTNALFSLTEQQLITVTNSGAILTTGLAHLRLSNPNTGSGQTLVTFDYGGTIKGGIRSDFAGNFNWHCSTGQNHAFYASTDNSVPIGLGIASGWQFGSNNSSFGGGVKVIGVNNATTQPSSNPSAAAIWWSHTSGALKVRSSNGVVTTVAAIGAGTVNSQSLIDFIDIGTIRTVSSATPTTVYSFATATGTSGRVKTTTVSRAITAPTAGAIGDTITIVQQWQYRNVGGTLTISAAASLDDPPGDTSMAGTAVTATASGANFLVQVANVVSATVDTQTKFEAFVC